MTHRTAVIWIRVLAFFAAGPLGLLIACACTSLRECPSAVKTHQRSDAASEGDQSSGTE